MGFESPPARRRRNQWRVEDGVEDLRRRKDACSDFISAFLLLFL